MARIAFALGFFLLPYFFVIRIEAQSEDCKTPRGFNGTCIPIRQCQPLLLLLTSDPLNQSSKDFLRRSRCDSSPSNVNPHVCCPSEISESKNNRDSSGNELKTDQIDLLNHPLLPKKCGRDLSQRIIGGVIAELDEFPWTALLEYVHNNEIRTWCGGVLISRRYVMTAAHCLKRRIATNWTLENVRLGEYDTSTERDCVSEGENDLICADAPVSIKIEEQIVHEQYDPLSNDRLFDVALLRLTRDVTFTDFIQPICLPSNYTFTPKLQVAGWGTTEEQNKASNVKRKATIDVADQDACAEKFRTKGVNLGPGQICAGGQKGRDSCKGDSGGPLMSIDRTPNGSGKWTVVGIVSFGHPVCGMEGWPGVYTKVIDFVPWALRNMRL